MLRIGLTGGIGAGKSTVATELAKLGAIVIDADQIARDVVAAGTPGLAAVVEEFGPRVQASDGTLDRSALAQLIFDNDEARGRLNGIIHPLVRKQTAARLATVPGDAVVVHDVPLIVEAGLAGDYDLVIVVGADEATRLDRLVADRGMSEAEVRSRMAAQADDAQRRAVADVWLDNSGSTAELLAAVRSVWQNKILPAARIR